MDTIELWARNGDAVREAIEMGALVHLDTACEELTDEFLLFAIESGLLSGWAASFPDPRNEPEISMGVILTSQIAARFAKIYSLRKSGYVLRSAAVLGAWGYSLNVLEPNQGLSRRGTSDDQLLSGDVVRKLLVQMEREVDPMSPLVLPPVKPSAGVKTRQRPSRRAVKGNVDRVEADARGQRVAAQLLHWYNEAVAPSMVAYAALGAGRRLHILDTTGVQVPLETGTYECSGVVKNDDGSRSRGYKLATLRTLLDHAGLITKVRYQITEVRCHDAQIAALKATFGWRAFATNAPQTRLSLAEAVLCYRHEYRIERIVNRLKSRLQIAPLFVKRDDQIEGLTYLLT
jgi:hypothetical protein